MKRKRVVVTLLIVALNVSLTQNVLAEENVASINEALETENTKSELQDGYIMTLLRREVVMQSCWLDGMTIFQKIIF